MENLKLISIKEHLGDNQQFVDDPWCHAGLYATIDFYKKVGFVPPWIGYFVKQDDHFVGAAGFKGRPINGVIEIAYGTFGPQQNKGFGTRICKALVNLSLVTDPSLRITARTLPENNYSTKVLKNNSFKFVGSVHDADDGEVWEWEFNG